MMKEKFISKLYMLMLLFALMFSACQKDVSIDTLAENNDESHEIIETGESYLILPDDIASKEMSEQIEYLESLSYEQIEDLAEHTKIYFYLLSINSLEEVSLIKEKNTMLSKIDMSYHLNAKELIELKNFSISNTSCAFFDDTHPEGTTFWSWTTYCPDNLVYRVGPIYTCVNGQWIEQGPFSAPTGESCNPATYESTSCWTFLNAPLIDPDVQKNISLIAAEMSTEWTEVMHLYINNADEINAIFNSSDEKHAGFHQAFKEMIAVNDFNIYKGIKKANPVVLDEHHIASIQNTLLELEKMVTSENLKIGLNKFSNDMTSLTGEILQDALSGE